MSKLQYEYVFTSKYQELYVRWYNPDNRESFITKYKTDDFIPPLYIPDETGDFVSHIDGTPLKKLEFTKYSTYKETLKKLENSTIVHGNLSKPENFIREACNPSKDHNHNLHVMYIDIETRNKDKVGYAKVYDPFQEISLIQVYSTFVKKFIIFGVKEITTKLESTFGEVIYVKFDSELKMLEAFIKLIQKYNPAIISGYYSNGYDIPYLTNRIKKIGLDYTKLSPVGIVDVINRHNVASDTYFEGWEWKGIQLIDYQDIYFHYTYNKLPNSALETVAQFEVNRGKVDYSNFMDMEDMYTGNWKSYICTGEDLELDNLYNLIQSSSGVEQEDYIKQFKQESYNKFVKYGLIDVELLLAIDEKIKYMKTTQNIGYKTGVNAEDVIGTLKQWKAWVYSILLLNKREVLPIKQQYADSNAIYVGGWTSAKPKKHKYVVSADFSSLYPSVSRGLECSLRTYIKPDRMPEDLKKLLSNYMFYTPATAHERAENDNIYELLYFKKLIKNKDKINEIATKYNITVAPNGMCYDKSGGSVYADLLREIYSERKASQKLQSHYEDLKTEYNKKYGNKELK